MVLRMLMFLLVTFSLTNAASLAQEEDVKNGPEVAVKALEAKNDDLQTDASTYNRRSYSSDYGGYNNYPGNNGYGATGYGYVDDKYNVGYDNSLGYGNDYSSYNGGVGYGAGYSGYNKGYNSGYGGGGYSGYGGGGGGGYSGYGGGSGYNGYGGYGSYGGYGGYGGSGGNGGLNSYYGYNNPYYQGANHLGFGYLGKRTGYGNIYSNAIAPSLVTGYRGYSRR